MLPLVARADDEPVSVSLGDGWELTLHGQYRPRLEVDSGLDLVGTNKREREFVSHRARLGLDVGAEDEGPGFALALQDIRIWGEESGFGDTTAAGFDVHEAYFRYRAGPYLKLRVGRQDFGLANERLLGRANFSQRGRGYDGARIWLDRDEIGIQLMYLLITETDDNADGHVPRGRLGDDRFFAVHVDLNQLPAGMRGAVGLYSRNNWANPAVERRRAVGGLLAGRLWDLGWGLEGYYQFGKIAGQRLSAAMLGGRIGYRFTLPTAPTLIVWTDFLSGDGSPQRAFDQMLGSRHKFHGELDFFTNVSAQTSYRGLIDSGASVEIVPLRWLTASVAGHYFQTAEADAGGDRALASELDFKVVADAGEYLTFTLFYGALVPEPLMGDLFGVPPTYAPSVEHRAYLMTDFSF